MKQRYPILIGLTLSLLLIVLLFNGLDLTRLGEALANANYIFLPPAFLLIVVGHFTRAIRWRGLLAERLPLRNAFSILNISYLFNGLLPFRLGEVARIFLATRHKPPVPAFTTLSTVVVERLLDLLSVIGMLGVVLLSLPVPDYVAAAGLTMGIGSFVGVALLAVFARRRTWAFALLRLLGRLLPLLRRVELEGALARFLDGLQPLASGRTAAKALWWSVVSWAFSVMGGYVLMFVFFPAALWTAVLLFIVMASLAVAVPYAPGAVGPYEAGVVVALTLTGFSQPEGVAVAFAIVLHATNLAVYGLLGVLGLLYEGVTIGQVARGARLFGRAAQEPAAESALSTAPLE